MIGPSGHDEATMTEAVVRALAVDALAVHTQRRGVIRFLAFIDV